MKKEYKDPFLKIISFENDFVRTSGEDENELPVIPLKE